MPRILVDTNVVIEAVRTGCWNALTGGLTVDSVAECRREALAGSAETISDYVIVGTEDLNRMHTVHEVVPSVRAAFKLAYAEADALDAGEHDLLAHAHDDATGAWRVCSPDKAAIRAAVRLGHGDRLVSLEELVSNVGARPHPDLRVQFTSGWLSSFRTRVLLEGR